MKTLLDSIATGRNGPPAAPAAVEIRVEWLEPDDGRVSGQALFLEHLSAIQNLVTAAARQHGLSQDDTEAFRSTVLVRMIEDDYAVLRRFRGHRSWRAYLAVVIQRICLEFRTTQWRNGVLARRTVPD
jgi:ABC-type arginine transport system ATPase subunit